MQGKNKPAENIFVVWLWEGEEPQESPATRCVYFETIMELVRLNEQRSIMSQVCFFFFWFVNYDMFDKAKMLGETLRKIWFSAKRTIFVAIQFIKGVTLHHPPNPYNTLL